MLSGLKSDSTYYYASQTALPGARPRRRGAAGGPHPGLGDRRLPGEVGALACGHRVRILRLARARHRAAAASDALRRARPLHRCGRWR